MGPETTGFADVANRAYSGVTGVSPVGEDGDDGPGAETLLIGCGGADEEGDERELVRLRRRCFMLGCRLGRLEGRG